MLKAIYTSKTGSKTIWVTRFYWLLLITEALYALLSVLKVTQGGVKHLSLGRLGLAGIILLIALGEVIALAITWRDEPGRETLHSLKRKIGAWVTRPATMGFYAFCAVGGLFYCAALAVPFESGSPFFSLFLQFYPLFLLIGLFGLQTLGMLTFFKSETTNRNGWMMAVTIGLVTLGAGVRLARIFYVDMNLPYRGGGLFVEFAQQISANSYQLPIRIPFYSLNGVPFAYPPLPFYLLAVIQQFINNSDFIVINLLPSFITVLCLPLFHLLTQQLGFKRATRLVSLLAYALLPAAFFEQIEGAGLAEASGSLAILVFAIALVNSAHRHEELKRSFTRDHLGNVVFAGLSWALCVLVSPGSAYGSILMFFIFSIYELSTKGRDQLIHALRKLVFIGIIAIVVSSPYWILVIKHFGLGIFTSSFIAQHESMVNIWGLISDLFGNLEPIGTGVPLVWNIVVFTGVIYALIKKHWFLLAWFLAFYLVPREGRWMIAAPASILAGLAITDVISPFFIRLTTDRTRDGQKKLINVTIAVLFAGLTMVNAWIAVTEGIPFYNRSKMVNYADAMVWIRQKTPTDSHFIGLADDTLMDWLPQQTHRTVINAPFGTEWDPIENKRIATLDSEIATCADLACIKNAVDKETGVSLIYFYIQKNKLSGMTKIKKLPEHSQDNFDILFDNESVEVIQYLY